MSPKKETPDDKKSARKKVTKRSTRKKESAFHNDDEAIYFMGPASNEIEANKESKEEEYALSGSHQTKQLLPDRTQHSNHHHRKYSDSSFAAGRFLLGIVLMFVGLVFLGQNMGWFDIVNFDLTQLWPLILVFLGFAMFSGGSKVANIAVVTVLVAGLLVVGVVFGKSTFIDVELSGEVLTEERIVRQFTNIEFRGRGQIFLEQGESTRVSVRSDKKLLSRIITDITNDTLIIDFSDPFSGFFLDKEVPIDFFITVSDIESIRILGSGKLFSMPLTTDRIRLIIEGSGEMSIPINAKEIVARISGSGIHNITGTTTRQIILINGSGAYRGLDLVSREAGVRVNGSGEIEINVSKELDAEIEGSGNIYYLGDPFISNSNVSGSGRVHSLMGNAQKKTKERDDDVLGEEIMEKLRKIDEVEELKIEAGDV